MKFSAPLVCALVGGFVPMASLHAAPPPPITAGEIAELGAAAATKAPEMAAAAGELRAHIAKDLADASTAGASAAAFMLLAGEPPVPTEKAAPPVKSPELIPGPNDTLISCDGGLYMDPEAGVLVYLKNVVIKDPRFNLSGANEVKIFLAKKAPPANPDPQNTDPKNPDKAPAGFGDPERIIASGAIVIDQKGVDGKDPIKASAALFSYDIKEDVIVLSGGSPWFMQGATALRAKAAEQSVRISPKSGELRTDGGAWETLLAAPQKP